MSESKVESKTSSAKTVISNKTAKKSRAHFHIQNAPLWIALAGVLVMAAIVAGFIALISFLTRPAADTPPITGASAQDVISYRDILQKFYDQSDGSPTEKRDQISQMIQNTLDTTDGKRYSAQVKLAEAIFYANNNLPDDAIRVAEELDPNLFTTEQKLDYYNALYYSYALKNDEAKAQEYTKIVYQLSGDLYGWEE